MLNQGKFKTCPGPMDSSIRCPYQCQLKRFRFENMVGSLVIENVSMLNQGKFATCPGPVGSSIRCPSQYQLKRFSFEIWCMEEIWIKIPRFIRVQLAGWSSFLFSWWILNPRLGTYLGKITLVLQLKRFSYKQSQTLL